MSIHPNHTGTNRSAADKVTAIIREAPFFKEAALLTYLRRAGNIRLLAALDIDDWPFDIPALIENIKTNNPDGKLMLLTLFDDMKLVEQWISDVCDGVLVKLNFPKTLAGCLLNPGVSARAQRTYLLYLSKEIFYQI